MVGPFGAYAGCSGGQRSQFLPRSAGAAPGGRPVAEVLEKAIPWIVRLRWARRGVPSSVTLVLDSRVLFRYGTQQAGADRNRNSKRPPACEAGAPTGADGNVERRGTAGQEEWRVEKGARGLPGNPSAAFEGVGSALDGRRDAPSRASLSMSVRGKVFASAHPARVWSIS